MIAIMILKLAARILILSAPLSMGGCLAIATTEMRRPVDGAKAYCGDTYPPDFLVQSKRHKEVLAGMDKCVEEQRREGYVVTREVR